MSHNTFDEFSGLVSSPAALLLITMLATAIPTASSTSDADLTPPNSPKLVVQITVDQLRGDLPLRYRKQLMEGGFRYLMEQETHYTNAHYRHANAETAVGHSTLFTGTNPSRHGIVTNEWFDQKTGQIVYNTQDDRHHLIGKDPKPH